MVEDTKNLWKDLGLIENRGFVHSHAVTERLSFIAALLIRILEELKQPPAQGDR